MLLAGLVTLALIVAIAMVTTRFLFTQVGNWQLGLAGLSIVILVYPSIAGRLAAVGLVMIVALLNYRMLPDLSEHSKTSA